MNDLKKLDEAALAEIIRVNTHRARRSPLAEEQEEAEALVEAAKDVIVEKHPIGTIGRQGLPDQG